MMAAAAAVAAGVVVVAAVVAAAAHVYHWVYEVTLQTSPIRGSHLMIV